MFAPDTPLRILVGTTETAGFTYDLGAGFAALGHQVTTALGTIVDSFHHQTYDMDIGDDIAAVSWPEIEARLRAPGFQPPRAVSPRSSSLRRLLWLISHHDVFVFMYTSLRPDRIGKPFAMGIGREYALLKRLGKKVVTYFIGPEARHASAYDPYNAQHGFACPSLGEIVPQWAEDRLPRPLRNLRRAELHSDVIFSQPNQAGLALRPYMHLFAPVDLAKIRARVPGREVPVIVHAPSDKGFKGTEVILAALDGLAAEGVRFDLRLLHEVPNARVLEELQRADVVVDQLYAPMHGRLGVEAMASGCALATADHPLAEPVPPGRPIWHVDVSNTREQLRRLLTDRALRVELAHAGRRYVERHHDHVSAARRILQHLEPTQIARYDHYPSFFARHYCLPPGERVPLALQRMTARIVRRWGLPAGVDPRSLVRRGLMAAEAITAADATTEQARRP